MHVLGPIQVIVWGWGVPFLIASFVSFVLLYCALLNLLGVFEGGMMRAAFILAGVCALSLMAADAGTTYVFGTWPFFSVKVDNLLNAPPVLLNAALLITLAVFAQRKARLGRPR
jgi:hypothetical protein